MNTYMNNLKSSTQEEVLDYLKTIPSGITFIHGKAGCGKTYLINKLVNTVGGCQILVPTNLAASLYKGARTIHSFFYGALDDLDEGFQNPQNLTSKDLNPFSGRIRALRMIIIDEISMVRSDLFEMMNQVCQKALNSSNPFGGLPIVLVGDMFQLPPIVSDDEVLKYLKKEYGGIYFFNSHVIQKEIQNIKLFELTKSFRQANDPSFVTILDAFRQPMNTSQKVEVMNLINNRVTNNLPNDAIYIASSNEEVRQVNTKKLTELPGQPTTIFAEYSIQKKDRTGHIELNHNQLPSSEDIFEIVVPSAYDSKLTFKKGARIMFTKNSKPRYINGDFGTIEDYNGQFFTIKTDRTHESVKCPDPLDRYKDGQIYERRYEMEYDSIKHRLVRKTPYIQRTKQYPIKLAYAFTIHKAQGQTYERVILDLNSHIFAPGQLYVALSRAKSLEGLFLTKPVTYSDIISDESIFKFLNVIRTYNGGGLQQTVSANKIITNSTCDQFSDFIERKEENTSSQYYLLNSLNSIKLLIDCNEYEKAKWELQKIIDVIISTYQLDNIAYIQNMLNHEEYTQEKCQDTLKTLMSVYSNIISNCPHKQFQSENRTVAF